MKITLIGYGKMGKTIEKIAQQNGHDISHRIDAHNPETLAQLTKKDTDVAIEFTQPESAFTNLSTCIQNGIPVVSGTTGWLEQWEDLLALCKEKQGAFFYASNFSIGVNLFFRLNQLLADMMNQHENYDLHLEEIHHTEKKDAPSGTAITLAKDILEKIDRKDSWVKESRQKPGEIPIVSKREKDVPGTHTITYQSAIDALEIKHTAFSREGFATGALKAAEWLPGRTGVFGMPDLLGL